MQTSVKTLSAQEAQYSAVNASPATKGVPNYTFETFAQMCEKLNVRYFRVATRKEGINILVGIDKKKAFFGRSETFALAFQSLLRHMQSAGVEIPALQATA